MNNIKVFLDIAKQDLEASKILYERKLYPQAVFFLQQSIEKAVKFAFFSVSSLTPEEFGIKIGHDTSILPTFMCNEIEKVVDLFKKASKKLPELEGIDLFIKLYERILMIGRDNNLSPQTLKEPLKRFDFTIEEINDFIKTAQNLNNSIFQTDKEMLDNMREEFIEAIIKLNKSIKDENSDQITKEDIDEIITKVYRLVIPFLTLFLFSILLNPHTVKSRYPTDQNPLEYYSSDNPLVTKLDEIANIIASSIFNFEEILISLDLLKET